MGLLSWFPSILLVETYKKHMCIVAGKRTCKKKSLLKTHLTAIKYDKMYSFHFNTIQPEQEK